MYIIGLDYIEESKSRENDYCDSNSKLINIGLGKMYNRLVAIKLVIINIDNG